LGKNIPINSKKVKKKDCSAKQTFTIRKHHLRFEDEVFKNIDSLYINFTSYAPQVFRKLLQMEDIDENEVIE
jgi:hypothetical protein